MLMTLPDDQTHPGILAALSSPCLFLSLLHSFLTCIFFLYVLCSSSLHYVLSFLHSVRPSSCYRLSSSPCPPFTSPPSHLPLPSSIAGMLTLCLFKISFLPRNLHCTTSRRKNFNENKLPYYLSRLAEHRRARKWR